MKGIILMKKQNYDHIGDFENRNNLLMFIQALDEVLFYYSFESYKMPALNSHFLCLDILEAKHDIDLKSITEGNFIPLAEEFEDIIHHDILLREMIPSIDTLLKKRDRIGKIVDYEKMDYKSKIGKYSEAAEYIKTCCRINKSFLNKIIDSLLDNIFFKKCDHETLDKIYYLTRTLATELVNGGYSPEYIHRKLKNYFIKPSQEIICDSKYVSSFLSEFTFTTNKYHVIFGVNSETAKILQIPFDNILTKPDSGLKKVLQLKHKGDSIVNLPLYALDDNKAAEKGYNQLSTIVGLHRISQHHKPVFIKQIAQVKKVDKNDSLISERVIKLGKNILLRANNESQFQSSFFDRQLLNNVHPPQSFFRAVSLHNNALDSKESTNQLLDLWTAIEILVEFKTGDDDKINVICGILTSALNRSYFYNHIEQLSKDIGVVLNESFDSILLNVDGDEQHTIKLLKILALKKYGAKYNLLFDMLHEYPLLQYRIELFSKHIFVNSKSVFNELYRHKQKVKWHIMRIYRNRNMIVHDGKHMPYLDIILGNLHYYIDALFEVLIEYYHIGITRNKTIFYDIAKEEMHHWELLGVNDHGKITEVKEINEDNFKTIILNGYERNIVKNVVERIANTEININYATS